jgi:DNA polymerase-3 subunit delta'
MPHALLFTGDAGVGKKMTATALAMACNCLTLKSATSPSSPQPEAIDACGDCVPCKKISGGHHPDVIRVAPLSSVIRIAQIRSLLQSLALKPNEADRRVVILSEAQTMNPEAGNALLKVLEEPPDRTLLVLTASQPSDLLPTVVSRCRHMRFSPLCSADVKQLLTLAGGIDPESVETVSILCGGSYTRAQQLIDSQWLSRRDWIIRAIADQMASDGPPKIRAWLALSEKLAKKKDLIEESLEIVTMWLRDVLVVEHDPKRVFNRDRLDTLSRPQARSARHSCSCKSMQSIAPGGAAIQYKRKIDTGRDGPANGRGVHLNIRETMEKKVGIRFKTGGKIYDFSCGAFVLNLG